MAANVSIACDPFTTWYAFTRFLSWSNNCEVADVLSDIPFISVGILVFGVSPLFLVLRRVSLSAVWLFASALLAFVAAVVDLGKLLANEVAGGTTLTDSLPVIRAREVLLALSIGFRFLFYWSYAAEPPRNHISAASTQTAWAINFRIKLEYAHEPHSASWTRWGRPGKLLGVSLLAAIVIITALQIAWRAVHQFHQYSSVYAADAALELLVSFLFLLKLLLNTVSADSPNNMLVHTFKECLAPISGLLVNIAIGVGGLLLFAFTESTVGRLLQAFEVYIIVAFVVVITFLKHRDMLLSASSSQGAGSGDTLFTLPEPVRGSTFRITPPYVETPRMSTILGTSTLNKESSREVLHRSARRSLNHVSSWVSSKFSRNRLRLGDEEVKLWNANNVKANPPYAGSMVTELRTSIVSSQEWSEHIREAPTNHLSIISALNAQSEIPRSMKGSIHSGRILHSARPDVPLRGISPQVQTGSTPLLSLPPSVSRGTTHTRSMATALQDAPSDVQSLASGFESRTSLEELLRQQSQLDRSIEALRLFSTRTSADSNVVLSPKSVELSRSLSTGQRTISSDVSLSNFPVPPWSTNSVPSLPSSPGLSAIKRLRGDRRVRLAAARTTPVQDIYTSLPPKSAASLIDIPSSPHLYSIPHTPVGEENERLSAVAGEPPRPDSDGTQYNVTSFIGGRLFSGSGESVSDVFEGLATPSDPRLALAKPWLSKERESGLSVGTSETGSNINLVPLRMLPLTGQLALSSQGDVIEEPVVSMAHGINERRTHSPAISIFLPTPATHPNEAENNRSTIRHPSPLVKGAASRSQKTFVRPRPPPLVIKSDTGQSPGSLRVQVLADD